MNNSELYSNFYKACLHYIYLNASGNVLPIYEDFVAFINDHHAKNPTSDDLTITNWNHATSEPNHTTLESYTVSEVYDTYDRWCRQLLYNYDFLLMGAPLPIHDNRTTSMYFTGPWSGSQNLILGLERNKLKCTICIPALSVSGNNTSSAIESTSQLTHTYRPTNATSWPIIVKENGTGKFGCLDIDSSGNVKIYSDAGGSNFSANTGQNGFNETTVSYVLS